MGLSSKVILDCVKLTTKANHHSYNANPISDLAPVYLPLSTESNTECIVNAGSYIKRTKKGLSDAISQGGEAALAIL